MKKITLIVAFIGMVMLQSCTKEEVIIQDNGVDYDTISEVFEYSNVDFHSGNSYSVVLDFPHTIYTSDMVLVYRLSGSDSSGDYWKPMPETYYFNDGTLDFGYDNDFTRYDAQVNLFGYDLPALSNGYKLNQVFRVVVIPAYFGNKSANPVSTNDYKAVIEYYNIDDKNISKIVM
jgi:hypothetical protein